MAQANNTDSPLDCLIVGGGPAGLTAAIYLGRFLRSARVIDAGKSRASLIPTSHNYPGFPEGISGNELLTRLRLQACRYGATINQGIVEKLEHDAKDMFIAHYDGQTLAARTLLLATGSADIEPALPDFDNAIRRGFLRHCPICDGYEVQGQKVGIFGMGDNGVKEALFIRRYTDDLTLMTLGNGDKLNEQQCKLLYEANIKLIEDPISEVQVSGKQIIGLKVKDGQALLFDTLYSMLGCMVLSGIATQLGARCDESGNLIVSHNMETSVAGLFAAGDVVHGLSQICVAAAHAAIAATAIHHRLS
ncbi:NAD(P)/FAD-dependent oxidoreductase [Janthinobacterium sp. 17J80-10]|uniref:NAD(P)/FAD-dependent oxidoreductase n=1 Tax=Janthinobacterium sp. 17J80-10 TaxID=2497863 RepID=UPI0013E8D741|nr:NAD(P)/FAD-dependent oxidoreductase [Janthinobacterium sp. 17J80-10]